MPQTPSYLYRSKDCIHIVKELPLGTNQIFLPLYLRHPAVLKLREFGATFAGISEAVPGFLIRRIPDFVFAVVTLSGEGELHFDGKKHRLRANSLVIVPPGMEQFYFQKGRKNWRFLWFHLRPDAPAAANLPEGVLCGTCTEGPALEAAMDGFVRELSQYIRILHGDSEQPPWLSYCDNMDMLDAMKEFHLHPGGNLINVDTLANTYAELITLLLDRSFQAAGSRISGSEREKQMAQLTQKLSAAPAHPWDLDEMSSLLHVSVPTLIRLCRKYYDTPPMQMLYHLRLKLAAQLLQTTDKSVAATAWAIGYKNPASFTYAFRKEYGIPPHLYRESKPAAKRPGNGCRNPKRLS